MSKIVLHNKTNDTSYSLQSNSSSNVTINLPNKNNHTLSSYLIKTEPITITVGNTGADFTTLNDAFEYARSIRYHSDTVRTYDYTTGLSEIIILLKTGWVMKECLVITDGNNYAYIRIKTETETIIDRKSIQDKITQGEIKQMDGFYSVFAASHGTNYPILEGRFTLNTTGVSGGTTENYQKDIFLIGCFYTAQMIITPSSILTGGFYTIFSVSAGLVTANSCTLKGNKFTSQVVRVHGSVMDINRSIIELGTELDSNTTVVGIKCCLCCAEQSLVRTFGLILQNSPIGIQSTSGSLNNFTTITFKNITQYGCSVGKSLVTLYNPNISQIGTGSLSNINTNTIIPGTGLVLM